MFSFNSFAKLFQMILIILALQSCTEEFKPETANNESSADHFESWYSAKKAELSKLDKDLEGTEGDLYFAEEIRKKFDKTIDDLLNDSSSLEKRKEVLKRFSKEFEIHLVGDFDNIKTESDFHSYLLSNNINFQIARNNFDDLYHKIKTKKFQIMEASAKIATEILEEMDKELFEKHKNLKEKYNVPLGIQRQVTGSESMIKPVDAASEASKASAVNAGNEAGEASFTLPQNKSVAEQQAMVATQAVAPAITTGDSRTLRISATSASWLQAKPDGKVVDYFLRKGESTTITFDKSLTVKFGNAGGVNLELDGRPFPFEGELGQIRTLVVN